MAKKVTMQLIAQELNISKGLVSKALTDKYGVSDEMRAMIKIKAAEMGYEIAPIKQKRNKKKCILLLTRRQLIHEKFWQPVIKSIEAEFAHDNIDLEYHIYDGENGKVAAILKEEPAIINADGYIIIQNNSKPVTDTLTRTNKPYAIVDPKFNHGSKHIKICSNNRDAINELTRYLIDKGHKRILYYGARNFSMSFMERAEGFWDCINESAESEGISGFEADFDNTDFRFSDDQGLTRAIKESKVTAIICANDLLAVLTIQKIKAMGLNVPADISIAGFDDIYEGQIVSPTLTTMRVDRELLGHEASRYIIDAINGKKHPVSKLIIDCPLIERESVREI